MGTVFILIFLSLTMDTISQYYISHILFQSEIRSLKSQIEAIPNPKSEIERLCPLTSVLRPLSSDICLLS